MTLPNQESEGFCLAATTWCPPDLWRTDDLVHGVPASLRARDGRRTCATGQRAAIASSRPMRPREYSSGLVRTDHIRSSGPANDCNPDHEVHAGMLGRDAYNLVARRRRTHNGVIQWPQQPTCCTLNMIIDGKGAPAADGATFETVSPATNLPIAIVPKASPMDVERAVLAARSAFDDAPGPARPSNAPARSIWWRTCFVNG